jgi:hypothetical protein
MKVAIALLGFVAFTAAASGVAAFNWPVSHPERVYLAWILGVIAFGLMIEAIIAGTEKFRWSPFDQLEDDWNNQPQNTAA